MGIEIKEVIEIHCDLGSCEYCDGGVCNRDFDNAMEACPYLKLWYDQPRVRKNPDFAGYTLLSEKETTHVDK